jgi:hypothetical protein
VDNRADEVGNTVRLTQPGEMVWVDFYMYVKDMGYGISSATLFFTSSTLSGEVFGIKAVASASRSMVSTTSEGGVLKASFWFEYADEAGRWGLRQLQLEDNAGNMRVYSDMDLLLFGSTAMSLARRRRSSAAIARLYASTSATAQIPLGAGALASARATRATRATSSPASRQSSLRSTVQTALSQRG